MPEDRIGKALRELPRTEASSSFRRNVLTRLDEPRPRLGVPAWGLTAVAAVALIVILSTTLRDPSTAPRKTVVATGTGTGTEASEAQLRNLRSEYQTLQRELLELRDLASRSRPLVGVDGTGQHDYLIDLRNLYAAPGTGAGERNPAIARPASFRR